MHCARVPRRLPYLLSVMLGPLAVPGCIVPLTVGDGNESGGGSGSAGDGQESTDSTAANSGLTDPSGPSGPSTGPADDTGASTGSEGSGSTGDCSGVCIADLGCVGQYRGCVGPDTIEVWETVTVDDCSQVETCGDACDCTGSTCVERDPEPCPPGSWCVQRSEDPPRQAECLPANEVCGGPDGLECAANEVCEYAEQLCPECVAAPEGCGVGSPLGRCVPLPEEDCGPPFPGQEQCGCDGMTYANECERLQAGVPLDEEGVCPK